MITGAHIIICSKEAEADRAFFREIPNFRMWMWVMAGRYFDFRRPSFAEDTVRFYALRLHESAQQDQIPGHRLAFLQRAQARAEELIAALAAFSPTLLARADEVIE